MLGQKLKKLKFSTLTRTLSINPRGTFTNRSTSCKVTGVDLSSPKEKRSCTELSHKFTLALRSNKAISTVMSSMTQEMMERLDP